MRAFNKRACCSSDHTDGSAVGGIPKLANGDDVLALRGGVGAEGGEGSMDSSPTNCSRLFVLGKGARGGSAHHHIVF